jgi:hypothetical protein
MPRDLVAVPDDPSPGLGDSHRSDEGVADTEVPALKSAWWEL